MSQASKYLVDIHITPWETTGTETPVGQRDFAAGQEPTAEEFDYHFYYVHKDIADLIDAIDAWLVPQLFRPESIELVGDNAGTFDVIQGADGRDIPVIKLAPGVKQTCQVYAIVRKNNTVGSPAKTKVRIRWSTAATISRTAVFNIKYLAAGDGESLTQVMSTIQRQVSDSAVSHGRVTTEVELPVLTQGKTLQVLIEHDGTDPADNMDAEICIHMIEVI